MTPSDPVPRPGISEGMTTLTGRDLRHGRGPWSELVVDPAPMTCVECGRPVTSGALRHAACLPGLDVDGAQLALDLDG